MRARVIHGLLAACWIVTSGCAAIFKGELDTIQVSSNPSAEVLVDGARATTTPGAVEVASRDPHEIVLKAPGYRDQVVFVEPEMHDGYLVLDVLLLLPGILPGVVALIVDGSSGAWYRSTPTDVAAVLVPEAPPAVEAPSEAPPAQPAPEPAPAQEDDDVPPPPPPLIPDEELPPPPPPS